MFEVLAVVGTVLIAAAILKHHRDRNGKFRVGEDTVKTPVQEQRGETQDGRLQAVPRDSRFAFVTAFGLNPRALKELHIYASAGTLDEFPSRVKELLKRLYANGYAVGEEIMALLHHGRPLEEGEAIYVAVVRDQGTNAQRTVAFLDRYRIC